MLWQELNENRCGWWIDIGVDPLVEALRDAFKLSDESRAEMGKRAERVRLARCDIRTVHAERRSGRTGQTHPIGGFIGSADYEGELAEYLPYLEAAQWTGVGRQTVWGKGEIRVDLLDQDRNAAP